MSDNINLKKILVFSSVSRKKLIEGVINDTAKATASTISSTMENALLHGGLVPQNRTAMMWVNMLYTTNRDIAYIISTCCSFLSAKNQGVESVYSCSLIPILNYYELYTYSDMFTLDSNLSSYVSTQINGIASALEYEASKIPETYLANDYLREATWLKSKSDQISKGEESLLYFPDYIAVFRTFCTVLSKYSRTYRFMMWICEHTAWINTSSSRYDLIALLKDISEDWD